MKVAKILEGKEASTWLGQGLFRSFCPVSLDQGLALGRNVGIEPVQQQNGTADAVVG